VGEKRQHHNITLGILAFAGLAFALQQTMIVPALPSLQRDLSRPRSSASSATSTGRSASC
jgi:predicted MFS family arabinose efflux permease